jgi:tRNA G18 (ribose-2'-O)-methylase SpoU
VRMLVMGVVEIDRADDPRLSDYVRLRDASLRRLLETERGLFIAEGEKVIRRAVEAGYRPRSFLLSDRWLAGLADVTGRWPDTPIYLVTERVAEKVSGFHIHRGALASLHREQRFRVEDILALNRIVVIEDVVDHTNVGAIVRNAAGLGWDGVLLAPRAADPLYRRAIKVSMGAVFWLPWARLTDWKGAPEVLQQSGFRTVALSLATDAANLQAVHDKLDADARIAILLGTEGAGLSSTWAGGADFRAKIPMAKGIDSLNVSAAAAIACYVLGSGSAESRGDTGQSGG